MPGRRSDQSGWNHVCTTLNQFTLASGKGFCPWHPLIHLRGWNCPVRRESTEHTAINSHCIYYASGLDKPNLGATKLIYAEGEGPGVLSPEAPSGILSSPKALSCLPFFSTKPSLQSIWDKSLLSLCSHRLQTSHSQPLHIPLCASFNKFIYSINTWYIMVISSGNNWI